MANVVMILPQFLAKLDTLPEQTTEVSIDLHHTNLPTKRRKQRNNSPLPSTSFSEVVSDNQLYKNQDRIPQICHFCNKSFSKKSNLTTHIANTHEGKRPFKCDICFATFAQKAHLKRHISSSIHK